MPDARRKSPSYLVNPAGKMLRVSWLTVTLVPTIGLGPAWLLFRWLGILLSGPGEPPVE